MANERTRTICVVNEKGGVGKTVTAVNLAAALSSKGKDVLVVDMDPQLNSTKGLGLIPENDMPSVYDLIKLEEPVPADGVITETGWEHLHLVPSHVDLSGIEIELASHAGRENRLKDALDPVTNRYDYVLVDTPPSLSLLTVNVLAYANHVLVPCQTHPYAYSALDELLETLAAVKQEINPRIEIMGVLATFFDRRTRVSQRILESLKSDERLQGKVFETVIRINTTIAESAYFNKPVVFFRRSSSGAKDYLALADEILGSY